MALHIGIDGTEIKALVSPAPYIEDTIDQRDTADFTVIDTTGTAHYQPGQQVTIIDDTLGLMFAGFIDNCDEQNLYPEVGNTLHCQCIGNHYHADKRHYHGPEYNNALAGDIIVDFIEKVLKEEGVQAAYARAHATKQADFASHTNTNAIATTNNGGQLEIAPSGTAINNVYNTANSFSTNGSTFTYGSAAHFVAGQGVSLVPFSAIQCSATLATASLANPNMYVKIWSGAYTVQVNDYFQYDIWINGASPEMKVAVDFVCTDGTTLRDANNLYYDYEYLSPHPNTDLTGLANNAWYTRTLAIGVNSRFTGKTIKYVSIGFQGKTTGTYTAYVRRITTRLNGGGTITQTFFDDTTASIPTTPQTVSINGYTGMSCNLVQAYNAYGTARMPVVNMSQLGIYQSSFVDWTAVTPDGTTVTVSATVDYDFTNNNAVTWLPLTAQSALPGLLPGANTSNLGTQQIITLTNGSNDPTNTPILQSYTLQLNASYQCVKPDLLYKASYISSLASGTATNLQATSGGLSLIANTNDLSSFPGGTTYGATNPLAHAENRTLGLISDASADCRLRFDSFGSSYQNFTMECDVQVFSDGRQTGFVYRTTGWQNANNTFAYSVIVTTTQIVLGRGTNSSSGGGTFTSISTVSLSLASPNNGDWHRLKIVVNGTSHQAYLDDVLYINATDSTYAGAGYVALRMYNGTALAAQVGQFRNMGVAQTLTGTWVSPAISLASLVTIFNTVIRTSSTGDPTQTTVLMEVSLDNGSTWTACTQNAAVPSLPVGTNVTGVSQAKVRLTLTVSTASAALFVTGLDFWVLGPYSATAQSISTPLSLTPVGRVGSASATWNATTPNSNTTVLVETSTDGITWNTAGTGASGSAPVSGINTQPAPVTDDFSVFSSNNYSSTNLPGGASAAWTQDITNTKVTPTGGTNAQYLYYQQSINDGYVMCDMDYSDGCGVVLHASGLTCYYLIANDASATANTPNTMRLYKVSGGSTLLASAGITFPRNEAHRIKLEYNQATLTAWFDDTQEISYLDTSSPIASGTCGLFSTGATGQLYQFFLQGYGDLVASNATVSHRVTLTTTDPTNATTLQEVSLSVRDPSIADGSTVPTTQYSVLHNDNPISSHLDDLATQSDHTWTIDKLSKFYFQPRAGKPAPWVLTGKDAIAATVKVANIQQEYRNVQYSNGAVTLKSATEAKTGDGQTTTFNVSNPVDQILSIYLDNQLMSIGTKGAKGYQYYYEPGSTAIEQDSSVPTLTKSDQLIIKYVARIPVTVRVKHERKIRVRKLRERTLTSGKVEYKETTATKTITTYTKKAAMKKARQELDYYTKDGRSLEFQTLRSGLVPGMILTVHISQHGFHGTQCLIQDVKTTWQPVLVNGVQITQPFFDIKCSTGAIIGDWTKLFTHMSGKRR